MSFIQYDLPISYFEKALGNFIDYDETITHSH